MGRDGKVGIRSVSGRIAVRFAEKLRGFHPAATRFRMRNCRENTHAELQSLRCTSGSYIHCELCHLRFL